VINFGLTSLVFVDSSQKELIKNKIYAVLIEDKLFIKKN
jgi:hypothetical protein